MSWIHDIPPEASEQAMATLRTAVGLQGEPSHAECARTVVGTATFGSLATLSVECPGFPFGSPVAYASDERGQPLLCLSALAEHSRNAALDPRASLLVSATGAVGSPGGAPAPDPLALARVTLVGELVPLTGPERAGAVDRFLDAHRYAFYVAFGDFAMYRLEVSSLRFVGGFGRMSWVAGPTYAAAEPDPLAPDAADIVAYMNSRRADVLLTYCRILGRLPSAESATLVRIDRYGMDLMAHRSSGIRERAIRIRFAAPVRSPEEAREATTGLFRVARQRISARN